MNEQKNGATDREEPSSPLKENYDLEYLLMGDIRILLTEQFDWRTKSSLLLLLNRLISNLPQVLELSSAEEYMCPVLERRPNLSHQVSALYQANLDCLSALELVRDRLESDKCIVSISEDFESLLKNWIQSFAALRHKERRMLQEAFTVDFGGEA